MNDSTKLTEEKNIVENAKANEVSTETTPKANDAGNSQKENTNVSNEKVEEVATQPSVVEDDIELNFLNKDFIFETMSIPTNSCNEFRMVIYVIQFARRNGIDYEFDDYGNVYLTKGKLKEGEYYPCVTSHLDTVQDKHEPYIRAGVNLTLKCETTKDNEHKLSVDSFGQASIGIGADDKGGVCICLSLFEHFECLKACFFLNEERGCCGSKELNKDWFKDVGYCIGYDSPDLFRAAWSCSGVKLFSYEFYEKYMKPVCDEWGLQDCFYSEPITDVMEIRKQTGVICMNFGNGGYNAHMPSEYCILEHMDHACGMGIALIDHIGLTRHELKHTSAYGRSSGVYHETNGIFNRVDVDDTELLEGLGDHKRSYRTTTYQQTTKSTTTKAEQLEFEMMEYVVNRYEGHIEYLKKDILDSVKKICEKSNIDYSLFENEIKEKFSNEIKF